MSASIRDIFFQECEDLTDALIEGLAEMADGATDDETVNAVFRAVHSIKGSGGAFGLDDLVGFAHKFETVLDEVRAHRLEPSDQLIRVLQRAGDVLTDLVDAARNETEANQEAVDSSLEALTQFLPEGADQEDEEEFVFEALTISVDETEEADDITGYHVSFAPHRSLYECGNDPLHILSSLNDLGETTVTAILEGIPEDASELDWEESFLKWRIDITTHATESAIREVFDFVEDLCDLDVIPMTASFDGDPGEVVVPSAPEAPAADSVEALVGNVEPVQRDTKVETIPTPQEPKKKSPAERAPKESRATLRVDLERVDRLINAVGELIINQAVIAQRIEDSGVSNSSELLIDLEDYKLLAREIQEGVMAIRAQPVKSLFQRMARIVRETADVSGKKVKFVTEGEDTEVDKTVVERLADPLTHMIRNAIDHGIELPSKRLAEGKEEHGTVRLVAQHRSGSVFIEIRDDGAGLNRERIRSIAVEKGIVPAEAELSVQEIDNLLFAPGFSTAEEVTSLSGRGVGMDVVKTAIVSLGGRIAISSTPGEGSIFSIALPLTLAVMDGMVINVGDQTMVVPLSSILETVRPDPKDLSRIGVGEPLYCVRGTYVPVIDLAESLGQKKSSQAIADQVLLLVRTERLEQCALAVDSISDQRQVVIKSLEGNYGAIPGISAATILGDGKIALIVDPDGVASSFSKPKSRPDVEATPQLELSHG